MTTPQNTHNPFSQNTELKKLDHRRLETIHGLQKHYPNPNNGLCLALSVQFLIEQRQHGHLGGTGYLLWLRSLSGSDHPRSLSITTTTPVKEVEKILRNRFRHQHLSTVLGDLIRLQASQALEIEGARILETQDCLNCLAGQSNLLGAKSIKKFLKAEQDYAKKIEMNGLKMTVPETPEISETSEASEISEAPTETTIITEATERKFSLPLESLTKQRYVDFIESLRNPDDNQYVVLATKKHAMAITYQRTKNESCWSFFDPNRGVYLYNDYEKFKSFMDDYFFNSPGIRYQFYDSQRKKTANIEYTLFSEGITTGYNETWKNFPQKEEIYILDALIKERKELSFNKHITARILDYTLNAESDITSIRIQLIHYPFSNDTVTLNTPFSSLSELYAAVLRRTDRHGYLVLNKHSDNPFDDVKPAPDLAGRVKQAIDVIHQMVSGRLPVNFIYKDKGLYSLLTEFFHFERNDYFLNIRELCNTIFNYSHREEWQTKAENLLKIAKNETFFNHLTGRQALEKAYLWSEFQAKNTLSFLALTMEKPSNLLTKINIKLAPHTIYSGDVKDLSKTASCSRVLGLAWLSAQKTAQESVNLFLNGLVNHNLLNEPESGNTLSDIKKQGLKELTASFETLKTRINSITQSLFTDLENSNLPTEPGSYFLSSRKHCLVLDITQENGQSQVTVYDPNIGELNVKTSKSEGRTLNAVTEILYDYLREKVNHQQTRGEMYGFSRSGFEYLFHVKEINIDELKNVNGIFKDFQQRLSSIQLQKIKNGAEINYENLRLPSRVFEEMGGFFSHQTPSISPSASSSTSATTVSSSFSLKNAFFDASELNRYLLNLNAEKHIDEQLESIKFLKKRTELTPKNKTFLVGSHIQKKIASGLLKLVKSFPDAPVLASFFRNQVLSRLSSKKTHNRLNRAHYLMQSYGYIRGFLHLIKSHRALQEAHDLTTAEKNALIFEYRLALADLTFNVGVDVSQYGLYKLDQYLQGIPTHVVKKYSSFRKTGWKVGKKLARSGGPFLSVLSAGFDIYYAWRAFDKLSVTEDPETRQISSLAVLFLF